jgi:hypothetical protein
MLTDADGWYTYAGASTLLERHLAAYVSIAYAYADTYAYADVWYTYAGASTLLERHLAAYVSIAYAYADLCVC